MKRRSLLGWTLAWPAAVKAQQATRRIVALLAGPEGDPEWRANVAALEEEISKLGWKLGGDLSIDYRWSINLADKAQAATDEFMKAPPDAILANGVVALTASQRATRTVPIVFTVVTDPVGLGVVGSLSRPGGNTTGFSNIEPSIAAKWLELLKEMAPSVRRVSFMFNPSASRSSQQWFQSAAEAAGRLGVELSQAPIVDLAEVEPALAKLASGPTGGLLFPMDAFINTNRKQVIALAARHRLPAIFPLRGYALDGGLLSYGPNLNDMYRGAATYLDRILKGERAGNLPVQQPTKFELVVNVRTAMALGLTPPPSLLARADEVIE